MGLKGFLKGAAKGMAAVGRGAEAVGGVLKKAAIPSPLPGAAQAIRGIAKGDAADILRGTVKMVPGVNLAVTGAKDIAAKGAKEAAAKQAAQQPAGGTTGTPKTELSPINIQKPEMIGSLAGSELLSEEQKAVLAARQEALKGMTPEEMAMRRSQMGLAQGASEQARQRQLASALARSGVRGGAAGAAQSRAAQLAAQERAAQAQELQLADEQRRREALTEMEKTVGGLTGEAGKRQFMGLAADIAGSQLGVARETGQLGAEAIGKYGELMAGQPQQRGALQNFFGGLF